MSAWVAFWVMLGLVIITAIVTGDLKQSDPARVEVVKQCLQKGKNAVIEHYSTERFICQ